MPAKQAISMCRVVLAAILTLSPCFVLHKEGFEAPDLSLEESRTSSSDRKWTAWAMFETGGNDDYAKIFKCWARHYMSHPAARSSMALRLACLSKEACSMSLAFRQRNPGVDITVQDIQEDSAWVSKPSIKYKQLYFSNILARLHETGQGVLHTDLDAFWVGNVESKLAEIEAAYPKVDMVYSQGQRLPMQSQDAWGFTLCNGFALYRNTPKLLSFLQGIDTSYDAHALDEQSVVNLALLDLGCTWKDECITSQCVKVGQCGELTVVVFDTDVVARGRHPITEHSTHVVMHPSVSGSDKRTIFREMGLCD